MKTFFDYLILAIGSVLVGISIELFLAPNGLVDGGVTALSIMGRAIWGWPTWLFLLVLNVPTILFATGTLGRTFATRTLFANGVAIVTMAYLGPFPAVTASETLVLIYGGVLLGLGVGLVVQAGGAIDGTEMIAVWVHRRFHVSVGTFLLAVNLLIIALAAALFGLEKGMFSFAIFFIVSKTIDFVIEGPQQFVSVMIISQRPQELAQSLMTRLSLRLTFLQGRGGYSNEAREIIYCITDRLTYAQLKSIVTAEDPEAILEVSLVSETQGIRRRSLFKKNA